MTSRSHGHAMVSLAAAWLATSALGCGAASATPRDEGAASLAGSASTGGDSASGDSRGGDSAGGDNEPRVLLRFRPSVGARYATDTRALTEGEGTRIVTTSHGAMEIEALDPATGRVTIRSRITSMEQTDPEGRPLLTGTPASLEGVAFRYTSSERARIVGEVQVSGTTPANATLAETIRSSIEQTVVELPAEPVRSGDTWEDGFDVQIPIDTATVTMRCASRYRMVGTEGVEANRAARIRFTMDCLVPDTSLAVGGGFEVRSHGEGEWIVSMRDGLSGRTVTEVDTRSTIRAPGSAQPLVIAIHQQTTMTTTPLSD